MKSGERGFTARKIAYCAVMTALLIAAQVALSFVSGVEIITLLLACFSACAGLVCGVTTAICFSLLRCLLWGFYPNVIVLYLVYYPVFAAIFALLGKLSCKAGAGTFICVNAMLVAICTASLLCCVLRLIKISALYQATAYALCWAVFGIALALTAAFNVVFICVRAGRLKPNVLKTFLFTATACVCTVCFTLLDDVITPAMLGFTQREALAYFYASFATMLTQTVCTLVTLSLLSFPIMRVIQRILK